MPRNVIILGAGFSYSAGIPLLGGFVDKMVDYHRRGKANGERLSNEDSEVFARACGVINELEGYHARVDFDSSNIEDILSILSFNVLAGSEEDRKKQTYMNQAIARTIELSCNIKHPGPGSVGQRRPPSGVDFYLNFWQSLFNWRQSGNPMPTIITFNYDLVLERLFFQLLCGANYQLPVQTGESFKFRYHYESVPELAYKLEPSDVYIGEGANIQHTHGMTLRIDPSYRKMDLTEIELLKLHSSLNFPVSKEAVVLDQDMECYNITQPQPNPYILPPIFNKFTRDSPSEMWRVALTRLREASNVVVIGYSLPRTDIYMQYFLKAALGQNRDLNKITVFDPLLYQNDSASTDMRSRYLDCFAKQLHRRISFDFDTTVKGGYGGPAGTAENFLHVLLKNPQGILYTE